MNSTVALSFAVILTATISCKTRSQAGDSSVKDIGVVNTSDARTLVIYEDGDKVYLKVCRPPLAPPLTRACPSNETPKFLQLSVYLERLPYPVDPYQRNEAGLSLVTKALEDAQQAVAAGNQSAQAAVDRLGPIKLNLEKIQSISDHLKATQQDLTYYEYQDEFSELLVPFGGSGGSGGPIAGMRFIPVQGRNFAMQETEVTRGQYYEVMKRYPEKCSDSVVEQNDHPVSCVSWGDANDFASSYTSKQGDGYTYRLPTEEEWFHAAGDIEGSTYGWCDTNSTHRVGTLTAHNGLYDMVGNVWEWTATSTGSYRVFRGGGWYRDALNCGSAGRSSWGPDIRLSFLGFRLLRTRP